MSVKNSPSESGHLLLQARLPEPRLSLHSPGCGGGGGGAACLILSPSQILVRSSYFPGYTFLLLFLPYSVFGSMFWASSSCSSRQLFFRTPNCAACVFQL